MRISDWSSDVCSSDLPRQSFLHIESFCPRISNAIPEVSPVDCNGRGRLNLDPCNHDLLLSIFDDHLVKECDANLAHRVSAKTYTCASTDVGRDFGRRLRKKGRETGREQVGQTG